MELQKENKQWGWVMMHKDISLHSVHGLDFNEKRILFAGLSKVNGKSGFASYRKMITITAKEYSEIFGINLNKAYEDMKEAADKLYDRTLKFIEENSHYPFSKGEYRWLVAKHGDKQKGEISFCFNPHLERYFTELKKNYTMFKIEEMRGIKSVYSQRMLEILLTYEKTKFWSISVEDFTKIMNSPKSCHGVYANLKKVVIDRCLEDLRKKGWLIDFEFKKVGKKINHLKFSFIRNQQLEII